MRVVEQFTAYDDANTPYTVVVRQSVISTSSLDSNGEIGGLKEYRLASGGALNLLSQTEFKIVATGQVIRRR